MFRVDLMPCSNDAALEQRESGFHGVGVNVTVCVLASMINRSVLVFLHFVECPRVDRGFVCHDHFDMASEICIDDLADGFGGGIFGPNQPQIAVALPDADYDLLDARWTPSAPLATYVGFVYLYGAAHRFGSYFLHRLANPVAEIPCRFVAHSHGALDLEGRDTLLGLAKQRGGDKPFPQRQVGIVEDRARRYAKLVMA